MPKSEFFSVFQELASHRVDFIVVGGVAAVLRGPPVSTFDLDVVHSTAPENIGRLLAALEDLDACYRAQPAQGLRPDTTHLSSPGYQLLMTRFGPVDLLGTIGKGRSYEDLFPHAVEMELGKELRVRVLNLETLIAVKEEVGDEKDLAMRPVLRRTLEESRRSRQAPAIEVVIGGRGTTARKQTGSSFTMLSNGVSGAAASLVLSYIRFLAACFVLAAFSRSASCRPCCARR